MDMRTSLAEDLVATNRTGKLLREAWVLAEKATFTEFGLARGQHHWGDTGFAMFTSWKPYRSDAENVALLSKIKSRVQAAGFGYVPTVGVGHDAEGHLENEPSLFVPAKRRVPTDHDAEDLRDLVIQIGRETDQWGVIWGVPGNVEMIDPSTASVIQRFTSFHPNALADYYSNLARKQGRSFHFESLHFVRWPQSHAEGVTRQGDGELFS